MTKPIQKSNVETALLNIYTSYDISQTKVRKKLIKMHFDRNLDPHKWDIAWKELENLLKLNDFEMAVKKNSVKR